MSEKRRRFSKWARPWPFARVESCAKLSRAIIGAVAAFAITPLACGQIATLDKGHQIFVNNGLQIFGLDTNQADDPVNYGELTAGNMTAVMWSYDQANVGTLSAGQKWGKWIEPNQTHSNYQSPATALNSTELAHKSDLVAIQVGDEQQTDMEDPTGWTQAWFSAAHANSNYDNTLLYVNSFFISDSTKYANFIANSNPDAISWDGYPFANPNGYYIQPTNWLSLGNTFRRFALGSYIGATAAAPRPYGTYVQTYHDTFAVDPGEVEIRWQQFAAWTMGYSFVDPFIYRGGNNNFGGNQSNPVFQAFKETARQGRNLSPALTRLISYGYGPSFVQGAGTSGIPGGWLTFDANNAQPSQRYLTGISNVTNLGTKNGGLSGDVYVGFFNPLQLKFGDPTGTTYFMVDNGLGGNLSLPSGQSDNTATVAETRQQMTLNFDFGVTGINSLLRLNRNTGTVDTINTSYSDGGNTVFTSLGGGKYQLQLKLDGGTGDLFKYNDGTAFVGVQSAAALGYWDNDANAGNNNVTSGAGLGGSGNWDAGSSKWFGGTSNSAYTANSNVVFAGTAGTVTLTSPQSVTSLQFKTNGYSVAGSTLTLTAPTITVDSGATATISSTIAGSNGLLKNGPGTLNLASAATYSNNTTINEGVLGIASAALGSTPGVPTPNLQINNGATLRFNANNLTLVANRQVVMGAGGGVIDTNGNNGTIAGIISGSALTKSGSGSLTLSNLNSHSSTAINGGTLVVSADANLGAVPANFTTGNLSLDGGTLQFGANFDINNNRGIALGAGGGTIDTQGFTNASGYNGTSGGFSGTGNLTKVGSGTFFAAATSGGANTTWKGKLIIKEGTWKIVASDGLPYNVPSADGLQAGQVTLDGGTWQIAATKSITNALRGITVAAGGGTIDTLGFSLTWAGPVAGTSTSATLTKIGDGLLQFNSSSNPGTYAGNFNINGGMVVLNGGSAWGDTSAISLADAVSAALTISGNTETIGSLAGGGSSGGNIALSSSVVTGNNNSSTVFAGVISGAGGLTKIGSGTFTVAPVTGNLYTGATLISTGSLLVNNGSGSGTGTGSVTVGPNGVLGGTGNVQGAVTNNGTVNPGAGVETLHLGGNYTQASSAQLAIELASLAGHDELAVTGTANLAGALAVSLLGGFAPQEGDVFEIMTAAGFAGSHFNSTSLPSLSGSLVWNLNYGATAVTLSVALPGDFNGNGTVDAADYVVWRTGLGTTYTQNDYNVWRAHFGQTASGAGAGQSAALNAVPEPSAVFLVAIAVLMWLGDRHTVKAKPVKLRLSANCGCW